MGLYMTVATSVELSIETMKEIAYLASSIVSKKVTSSVEMNGDAVKIAESAGIVVGDVFDLVWRHINQRFPNSHPSLNTEAYNTLKKFRGKN